MDDAVKEARFWDRTSRKYEAAPVADPEAYERTLDRARHFLHANDAIFEFGCGTGTTALRLAPFVAQVMASDISPEMIDIAREKARSQSCDNVAFETGAMGMPQGGVGNFDAVLAFNVLHLVPDRGAALRHVHGVLKSGGFFISKTPCLGEMNPFIAVMMRVVVPAMRLFGRAPRLSFFSASQLEREIAAVGFLIVERGHHASSGQDIRPFIVAHKA